jgi:phosphatidylglycerophosphate synthase
MSVVRSDIGIEKVYRIFSKYIVDKIINTNITPNNLSWLSFLLIVVSMPFIIFKENNYFNLISFILINLSLIFDCADGDLAVKKKLQSSFGAHLDCTLDRLADNFFILAIIFANYINGNNIYFLFCGLIFIGFRFCIDNVYFSMIVFLPNFDQNNLSKSVLFKFVEFFIFTRTNMLFWGSCFIILSLHKEYLLLMGVYTLVYYFAILIYTYLKSYKK